MAFFFLSTDVYCRILYSFVLFFCLFCLFFCLLLLMLLHVQRFKESWAPIAARFSVLIHVFACPDRLTKHQLSHFAFGKTQVSRANGLFWLGGWVGD